MKKLFILCFSNIKKAKSNSISLLVMFIISSLLFNAGMLVLINFGSFFDKNVLELNTSDTYYLISNNLYTEEVEDYIVNHENINDYYIEMNIWGTTSADFKGEKTAFFYTMNNADIKRDMSEWKIIGEALPLTNDSIYLPISFKLSRDFEIGNILKFNFGEKEVSLKVHGFVEDIFFVSQDTGLPGFYVNNEVFNNIINNCEEVDKVVKVFANLNLQNKEVEIGLKKLTGAETLSASSDLSNSILSLNLSMIKAARSMMATMIAVIFVSFAAIIVIVCLLVVRFSIGNSIDDDMTKIGSLKAIGYTSKQIISSIVLQFSLIALVGTIIGISATYLTIPLLSDSFSKQSALLWEQGFDFGISLFTLFFINIIVILISILTSRRIYKLDPIIALRGGIVSHNFRKNYIPLEKSKLNLTFSLSLKSTFNRIKQTVLITIISIAISFAGAFAVVMYYNTNVDTKAFKETPGSEVSDISAVLAPGNDSEVFLNEILNFPEVRKAQYIDNVNVIIEDIEALSYVMDDYSARETITLYEGRYPIHNNEIVINGYLAEMLGKNIGDEIVVKYGDRSANYIITGFNQGSNMLGMNVSLTTGAFKKILPSHQQSNIYIYLKDGINLDDFINRLETLYSEELTGIIPFERYMEEGASSYYEIVSQIGITILLITFVIIVLVLYFVITASIIQNKKALGIQKALGFNTIQLMNQMSLSFLFPVIIGAIIGCILGITLTTPILSIVQRSMGIMKSNFIITPLWIILLGVGFIIVSYISSLLITLRIKNISTYSLITE